MDIIVSFGKYKNQPLSEMLNDKVYINWCKQQKWFKKTDVYPLIIDYENTGKIIEPLNNEIVNNEMVNNKKEHT